MIVRNVPSFAKALFGRPVVQAPPPPPSQINGLRFPSNGESGTDDFGTAYTANSFVATNYIAFVLTGANLPPSAWPMTVIWRVGDVRQHTGYHTAFFWGDISASPWLAQGYYGFHPYPQGGSSGTVHNWEISTAGLDIITDANGNDTTVIKDGGWFTQAARITNPASTTALLHEYWWNLNVSQTRKIVYQTGNNWTTTFPKGTPGIVFGDAPWARMAERMSATLGPVKILTAALSDADIFAEAADMTQLVTPAAQAARWWFKPSFASANDLTDPVTGKVATWEQPPRARLATNIPTA